MSNKMDILKTELQALNAAQLDELIEYCYERKEAIKREAADRIIAELRERMRETGIDAEFILEKLGGRSAAAKPARRKAGEKAAFAYVNPDNPAEGWSGRGRKPAWLKEKADAGVDIETFRV